MLKWTGTLDGRPMIGLGITDKNIEELRKGYPIYIHAEDMAGLPFDILIMTGKDEQAIFDLLERSGNVQEDTKIQQSKNTRN